MLSNHLGAARFGFNWALGQMKDDLGGTRSGTRSEGARGRIDTCAVVVKVSVRKQFSYESRYARRRTGRFVVRRTSSSRRSPRRSGISHRRRRRRSWSVRRSDQPLSLAPTTAGVSSAGGTDAATLSTVSRRSTSSPLTTSIRQASQRPVCGRSRRPSRRTDD
jgi:hypothetical protein